jgi:hypothetical protein
VQLSDDYLAFLWRILTTLDDLTPSAKPDALLNQLEKVF